MSIFKDLINLYKAEKEYRNEAKFVDKYIDEELSSQYKNAYYMMCGECDVYLQTPQKYDMGKLEPTYLETDNIPVYVIRFKTPESAHGFIENNFFMGVKHQKSVEIYQHGPNVIMRPNGIDYKIHIEVDSQEVGKKLVKMFRRQYMNNQYLITLKQNNESVSQAAECEIEKIGIEF